MIGNSCSHHNIFQICFAEQQFDLCAFTPVLNSDCTEFFENSVIVDLVRQGLHQNPDWFGVFSWRLQQKFSLWALPNAVLPRLRRFVKIKLEGSGSFSDFKPGFLLPRNVDVKAEFELRLQQIDSKVDAVSIISLDPVNLMRQANRVHPGFEPHFRAMSKYIGIDQIHDVYENPIFFNYWLMRPDIVSRYVQEALIPAMEYLSSQEELYKGTRYRFKKLPDALRGKWGSDYYPMHPFLLERLPTVWLRDQRITTGTLGF